jgi:glutamine synthetase
VNVNIYDLSPEQERRLKLDRLPSNLLVALQEMKKDSLIRSTLGEHIFNKYLSAKVSEWEA